ncbi:DUF960 domain-containing protein [Clostridium sp. P21]|uniref:DUF960 domain-containing protein n=1 Tax=Clostridium muellerianum TaxID=2716538 RepID=A0A7Y0EKL6_9CLOT|nr:DUF960 domain-containing protein [Clostridium muellerianum]NMM65229.1 DUF960 domain-containing protein [Clostridium muellerianum]
MFDNTRYITRGIKNEIPLELQLFIWNCIDELKGQGKQLDYLQVFELKREIVDDIAMQKIEHRQEVPKYEKTYKILPEGVVSAKIFVIDDNTHSTMLLAEEY